MDVEDVSGIKQWMELLDKQKAALVNANKRKGEQPKDRKSLGQLISQHMASHARTAVMKRQNNKQIGTFIYQSFVAPPYPPCVAPSRRLQKIYLKDMKLQTHHVDSFLLLRVATPAVEMTAVMAVLEDEVGDGVLLQLYQQEYQCHRALEDTVKLNSVCVIKEPYFKVMNDGEYGVRVDHVNDIIWLPTKDDRIPLRWRPKLSEIKEAKVLKQEGNAAIKTGKTTEAAELYTLALELTATDEEARTIRLNRSLAHLKLGFCDKAIEDAGELNMDAQLSDKAFYRVACAMSGLGRFSECLKTLELLLAHHPDCEPAKKELARIQRLLREQDHGEYDYKAMYEAAENTPPCLDNAMYIGAVEAKDSEGRGRGLFATKDIAAGQLLLCEKAFAHCFAANEADRDTSKVSSRTTLLIDTQTNRAYMGAQADLITRIIWTLQRNPSLMPKYNSLYHGDYVPVKETSVDGMPVIDTFLVERIMSLNVFGCPRTSLKAHLDRSAKVKKSDNYHTCGIFITASYINHSCHSNARRSFIGDMQIVRAARDIPAGTEITFWYAIPEATDTYDKTQEKLANWGFRCTCITCQAKKKTKKAQIDKRSALRKDLQSVSENREGIDLAKAERISAAIEQTYTSPATTLPRLALWDFYLGFTQALSSNNKLAHAITYAWKTLTSLGFVIKREQPASLTSMFEVEHWGLVMDQVVDIWVHLWVAYAKLAPNLCSICEGYARVTYKICIGEDETFGETYGDAARKAMCEGANLAIELGKIRL